MLNNAISEKKPRNRKLLSVTLVYVLLGILLLPAYQHQINPDGISYINIAQQYLSGRFQDAINGWWGPLFSWLLLPFLAIGVTPLMAAKIISLGIGAWSIFCLSRLGSILEIPIRAPLVLTCMIPFILYCAYSVITPDFLLAVIFLYYLGTVYQKNSALQPTRSVLCGVWGAALYLCKSYGFVFFLIHFTLVSGYRLFSSKQPLQRSKIVLHFLLTITVFFALSGIWIGLISWKYHRLTIGAAGTYNFRLVGPKSQGQAVHSQGFLPIPNQAATSAYEDPSYFPTQPWNPFTSWSEFRHLLRVIENNSIELIKTLQRFSAFSLLLICGTAISIAKNLWWGKKIQKNIVFIAASGVLYSIGFLLLIIEERYFWGIGFLLFFLALRASQALAAQTSPRLNGKRALVALILLSFTLMPTQYLLRNLQTKKDIYETSLLLKNRYAVSGNIASNAFWHESLYIAYHLRGKYLGQKLKGLSGQKLRDALQSLKIDYYFVWSKTNSEFETLEGYPEITQGAIPYLRVYRLCKI